MHGSYRYAYLHGFASSHRSLKGVDLRARLARDGVDLELLELNVPDFESLTVTGMLAVLDDLDGVTPRNVPLRLIGSSMGGYVAALWASRHPERVGGLFLLCPGFDLVARWPMLMAPGAFASWERDGSIDVADGGGRVRPLRWGFIEDLRRHEPWPEVTCPTCILHGLRDEVVPFEGSRQYVAARSGVELVGVDDDHRLLDSRDRIEHEVRSFFGLRMN